MGKISIRSTPSADEIWSGIGGHFDSLGQIINEFVDNSISNFEGNPDLLSKNILITLTHKSENCVEIRIEDTGTGIKNLDAAFTLGCRDGAESPLNEHGFGLKHALATAVPSNRGWCIYTRTSEDMKKNAFKKIEGPYSFDDFSAEIVENSQWPGAFSGTGTIVKFECIYDMYTTLGRGIKGGVTDFEKIAALLYEDLGFIYAGIISNAKASIMLKVVPLKNSSAASIHPVGAITPDFEDWIKPGKGSQRVNLVGDGAASSEVEIHFQFGKSVAKEDNSSYEFVNTKTKRYYKNTMTSSGVEIRINGRVICHNLFKEIWGIEKHNSYNSFLVTLDLISDNPDLLPKTRTSKNGLREGDPKLEKLFRWLTTFIKDPPKNINDATHETDLFQTLCSQMNAILPEPKLIRTEMPVFTKTGNNKDSVRIDLYKNFQNTITIYEGKKDQTTCKDVYQLRMYWDGLVFDGITPNEGILVADSHPASVLNMIQHVNLMKDANGNNYNFSAKNWSDLIKN